MLLLTLALSCAKTDPTDSAQTDTQVEAIDWSAQQIWLTETVRDRAFRRAIMHLHSPYSHDACDGDGLPDGAVNEPCLDDLRYGLCASAIDLAFITDHPSHAAEFEFIDWLLQRGDDVAIQSDGGIGLAHANTIDCGEYGSDGTVTYMVGVEDELMPLSLEQHLPGTVEERDALYNQEDAATIAALREAGGAVMLAHTESRDLAQVEAQLAAGLTGFEMFNLHAMFAPDIREDYLGIDGIAWIAETAPFLDADNEELVPDLAFLAVYQQQDVTIGKWDAMNAAGIAAVGIAGTDAHQNVLPTAASDGERFDSYRRMTRWFSNWLLVDATGTGGADATPSPDNAQAALEAGRVFTVFEALGTPQGLDVHLDAGGTIYEIGSDAPAGTLNVACPTLHPESPRGAESPTIRAEVLRDGALFAEGCGAHEVSEPGAYRVVFHIDPTHLTGFLDELTHLARELPWIYSNPIRVR